MAKYWVLFGCLFTAHPHRSKVALLAALASALVLVWHAVCRWLHVRPLFACNCPNGRCQMVLLLHGTDCVFVGALFLTTCSLDELRWRSMCQKLPQWTFLDVFCPRREPASMLANENEELSALDQSTTTALSASTSVSLSTSNSSVNPEAENVIQL